MNLTAAIDRANQCLPIDLFLDAFDRFSKRVSWPSAETIADVFELCYKICCAVSSDICPMPCAVPAAIVTTPVVEIMNCRLSSATDISSKELTVFPPPFVKLPKTFLMFVSCNDLSIQVVSYRRFLVNFRWAFQHISICWKWCRRPTGHRLFWCTL